MNIKLPIAVELKKLCNQKAAEKTRNLNDLIENFINDKICPAMMNAASNSKQSDVIIGVNIPVPPGAYDMLDEFYSHIIGTLSVMGYIASKSHDGGGQENTLQVSLKLT